MMDKYEAGALVDRVLAHPERATGREALNLQDALWSLVLCARDGEDIRPLLARRP